MSYTSKIYYNINILYDDTRPCDECVSEVGYDSGETILDRGSDYYCNVINFSLPLSNVPIMFVDIQPYPNTDINKTIYKVALEFDGEVSTADVIFTPSDLLQPLPKPPTANKPNVPRSSYYTVYTYTKFMEMVNAAYGEAFSNLSTAPVGSEAPYLRFDPSTGLFKLITDTNYGNDVSKITVFMNYYLESFFIGFSSNRVGFKKADGRDHRIVIDTSPDAVGDNGLSVTVQNFSALANWNCIRSLQIRSPLLQIANEYVPSNESQSDGRSGRASILSSFNPIFESGSNAVARSQISYTLSGANRLIDVISTGAITKISLSVWYTDELNNEYRLILSYREQIQIKLCFIEKDTYSG